MKKLIFYLFLSNFFIGGYLFAEPFVVYEYSENSSNNSKNQNSYENEDYSTYYRIKKNDSLSGILDKFYGSKNLNLNIVKSAVVLKNKHAFVRNNANFMFANKKLYLPSVNEIKDMIYKNVNKKRNISNEFSREQDIYYFGN
tara:strand:- start:827 stop:1252 length:426 start_codon:yes stop_codon:yes gene_type:complete